MKFLMAPISILRSASSTFEGDNGTRGSCHRQNNVDSKDAAFQRFPRYVDGYTLLCKSYAKIRIAHLTSSKAFLRVIDYFARIDVL